jgi:hypothetical protein
MRISTLVSSSLAQKYQTRVEVTDSVKYRLIYEKQYIFAIKSFTTQFPGMKNITFKNIFDIEK